MRMIDANALKTSFEEDGHLSNYIEEFIDNAPTIDAEPVRHGRWQGEGDGYADGYTVLNVWYCSECGYCIDEGTDDPSFLPKYCLHCGAKMDGGKDDENA